METALEWYAVIGTIIVATALGVTMVVACVYGTVELFKVMWKK